MKQIVAEKVIRLRENLHLRATYMADLLQMDLNHYLMFEQGEFNLNGDQISLLAKALGVHEEYLFVNEVNDNKVLARTDDEQVSENDKRQIAEFKNFQKKLGKKEIGS